MTTHFEVLVDSARNGSAAFGQVDRMTLVQAAKEHLEAKWAEVRARHEAGESGQKVLRKLSEAADEVVKGIESLGWHRSRSAGR